MFLMSTFEKANQKQIFFVSTFLDYYRRDITHPLDKRKMCCDR